MSVAKPPEPEVQALGDILAEFAKESDRGAALIAASFVDERLREILHAFSTEVPQREELLVGPNAPLGTFSARATAAYALGLIEENEFREITIIRKIRNEFGHQWRGMTFESGKIASLADQLPWLGPPEKEAGSNRRSRFNAAIAILLVDLLWRVRHVQNERRQVKVWPSKARK